MGIAGACSLGFVGAALPEVVLSARPVNEVYSASLAEWALQIFGAILTQVGGNDNGFIICSVFAWSAAGILVLSEMVSRD